jgi:hypothetical protein
MYWSFLKSLGSSPNPIQEDNVPDRLARLISVIFDSSFLSLPIFLALGFVSSRTPGLVWAIFMVLIVTGIPLAYLLIGHKRRWVSDLELSHREERPRFILVSLSSDVLALAVLWLGSGPHLLRLIVLTYFCLAIVMFTISSFWKISMHMAGVGGFSIALVFVFGTPALWFLLSLPLVAWARLKRHKHTPAQLVAGALAGALVTVLVFGWVGKWI